MKRKENDKERARGRWKEGKKDLSLGETHKEKAEKWKENKNLTKMWPLDKY